MNTLRKNIRICDYFMGCTFAFMIVIRFLTIGYLSNIAEVSGATIEQVSNLYEMDIVAKLFINLQQFGGLLLLFIIPAIAMALYLYFRKKTLQGLFDVNTLYFFVTFTFFVFLLNIVNDLAAYLGRII